MTSHGYSSLSSLLLLFTSLLIFHSSAQSIIQLPTARSNALSNLGRKTRADDSSYCESWRFSVETNDAGIWTTIPSRCLDFVKNYMIGDRYLSDIEIATEYALTFARTIEISGDGKDAWVFDIDETLLSGLAYYEAHGFGSVPYNPVSYDAWMNLADAPALSASLNFYNELKQRGFKIFLLTGRDESSRNVTEKNLLFSGFSNWERLFLRGPSDEGKLATIYKSEKRSDLVNEGYRIRGSSGDQWSDLLGFAVAERLFKLPNPMYYIP